VWCAGGGFTTKNFRISKSRKSVGRGRRRRGKEEEGGMKTLDVILLCAVQAKITLKNLIFFAKTHKPTTPLPLSRVKNPPPTSLVWLVEYPEIVST
jgi:hypothetical protein